MNKKNIIAILAVIILLLVGGLVYAIMSRQTENVNVPFNSDLNTNTTSNTNANTNTSARTGSGSENKNSTPPEPQASVYENNYLKITLSDGWTSSDAVMKTYGEEGEKTLPNPAAVNITKGNYILYINANAQQASGVEGGRFAEIAMGAPSADAVVTVQPSEPCGTSETVRVGELVNSPYAGELARFDWYVSSSDKSEFCAAPKNASVWY